MAAKVYPIDFTRSAPKHEDGGEWYAKYLAELYEDMQNTQDREMESLLERIEEKISARYKKHQLT